MNYEIIADFYEASYLLTLPGYELLKIQKEESGKTTYLFKIGDNDISADIDKFNNDTVIQDYITGIKNLRQKIKKYHRDQKKLNKKSGKPMIATAATTTTNQ